MKLRVYDCLLRKAKLYSTIHNYSQKDFKSIWETQKPRKEHKDSRLELMALEKRANDEASKINPFAFKQLEKRLFRKIGDGKNVYYHYENKIENLKKNGQVTTAELYGLSMKSLKLYSGNSEILNFREVNEQWLEGYQNYMHKTKGRSLTTVSIYLRNLRTIFNEAIAQNDVAHYPFGKKKYQMPNVKAVKKALTKDQLKSFYEALPKTPEQEKAKDFWFFSYCCNGMNIKDIALLKNENIDDEKIVFYRAKTIKTSKAMLKPVMVYLTEQPKSVLKKYRNTSTKKGEYVFDILDGTESPEVIRKKVKNFTSFINQHIQIIAKNNNLPEEISSYWARHSFATNAIRNGASMEFVGEALNHSNIKTTQGYFAGFEDEAKKKIMEGLMQF